MRRICFFILLCCLIFAESKKDSLLYELEHTECDTTRVNILNSLAEMLLNTDPKSSLKYANEGLDIARKIKYLRGMVESYNEIGVINRHAGDYNRAMEYYGKCLELAQKIDYKIAMSISYNNIGMVYIEMGNYDKALEYLRRDVGVCKELADSAGLAVTYNNIGMLYNEKGEYNSAIKHFHKSLKIREQFGDRNGIAAIYNNIASIYANQKNCENALEYYKKSLEIYKELGNKRAAGITYNNIGTIYSDRGDYDRALEYYREDLRISQELGETKGMATSYNNIGRIYYEKGEYNRALYNFRKALDIYEELGNKRFIAITSTNIAALYNEIGNTAKAIEYCLASLEIAREIGALEQQMNAYIHLSKAYQKRKNYSKSLEYHKLYAEVNDSIFSEKSYKQIAEIRTKYETEKKEQENRLLKKDIELEKTTRNSFIGGFLLVLVLALAALRSYITKKRDNRIIAAEKAKSESLLLNILPVRVASDLKETGKTEPESFENATVYFSDIVGFTKISSGLTPKFLIGELSDIFTFFDNIMDKHDCERIKTIGDAYLAVCGMPTPNPNHAENIVHAASEIVEYIKERNANSEIQWRIRIGIHTGRVVGGVVGIKKYIYDVFGDTIDIASSIQANSIPMEINVSETTYNTLKEKFKFKKGKSIELENKGIIRIFSIS